MNGNCVICKNGSMILSGFFYLHKENSAAQPILKITPPIKQLMLPKAPLIDWTILELQ